jgi:hypothetical protein
VTLGHFVYIPGILLLGIVVGWVLAARASAARTADDADRRGRAAARAARARARAADPPDTGA